MTGREAAMRYLAKKRPRRYKLATRQVKGTQLEYITLWEIGRLVLPIANEMVEARIKGGGA